MKQQIWMATAIAVSAGCVVAAAQTAGQSGSKTGQGSTVTLTGCVQPWSAAGTSGTTTTTTSTSTNPTTSSSRADSYVLVNATVAPSSTAGTAGTTGTTTTATTSSSAESPTSTSGGTMTGASYLLEGHESDVKKHVGHRVEVTGMMADSMGSSPTTTGTTAGGATTTTTGGTTTGKAGSATGDHHAMPTAHLRVSSIRMISAECSNPGR